MIATAVEEFVCCLRDGYMHEGRNHVPPAMMSELYRACGSERKHLAKFPGGTHNETWSCAHYYQTITYFLEEIAQMPISNNYIAKSTKHPPPTIVSSECGHAV